MTILFEELGLSFDIKPVNIRAREQQDPEIAALKPYAKSPIVTRQAGGDQRVLFESGAILSSFAERTGQLLPTARDERDVALT